MGEKKEEKYDGYEIPDVLLEPPKKYTRIRNEFGVCGKKPNLYYNGKIHRIWVLHVVDGVNHLGSVEAYVDRYRGGWDADDESKRKEMMKAVKEALQFYEEYRDVFEEVRAYREWKFDQIVNQQWENHSSKLHRRE